MIFGLGMLECGLTWDFGELVLQNELVGFIKKVVEGIPVNDDTLDVPLIKEVGAGGEFISNPHTFKNMRILSSSTLADRGSRDAWNAAGNPDIVEKAYAKAIDIIENYTVKPLSPEKEKGIDDIVTEAKDYFTQNHC